MSFTSESREQLARVRWPDSELVRVEVGYDDVRLLVREPSGALTSVVCSGHLGYELTGFWDETVIVGAELAESGGFLDRCSYSIESRLGASPPASGSDTRNSGQPMQLTLTFSDDCKLYVVAKKLRVEAVS